MSAVSVPAARSSYAKPLQLALIGVSGYGLGLLTKLLLANLLGREVFGDYNVAFAILSMLASLSLSGTDMAASRFLPGMHRQGDHGGLRGYFTWNRRRVRLGFAVVLGLYAVFLLIALSTHLMGYKRLDEYHLAFHSLWVAPIAAFPLLIDRYLVATGHARTGSALITLVPNLLLLAFFAVAAWGLHLPMTYGPVIIGIWTLCFTLMAGLQLLVLRGFEPALYAAWRAPLHGAMEASRKLWRQVSDAMLVMRVNGLVLWHLDLIIVEIAAPDEAATGLYAAVLVVARILQLIPTSVSYMIRPLCGAAADDPTVHPELQRAINSSNAIVLAVCSMLLACMLFGGHTILGWFGPGFAEARGALTMIAIGAYIEALMRQSRVILQTTGGERIASRISTVSLVVVLAAGFVVTHAYSFDGMAAVTGIVLAGKGVATYLFARPRLPGVRPLSVI